MQSFIDQADISVAGGNGGDGAVSFLHEKYIPKGGPDGGDGGDGGSVYLEADANINTLYGFRHQRQFKAVNGEPGRKKNQHGKNGPDLVIKVPIGTIVTDSSNGQSQQLTDLTANGQRYLVASGGRGGKGNARFATSVDRRPRRAIPGQPGIEKQLHLELKLLADIGLVGLPNAGKSSLLQALTTAQPKIANYPFTTLEPNLGVVTYDDQVLVLADIPGLIEGASEGKGLGDQFLRHITRTSGLLHLISLDPTEPDLWTRYQTIQEELKAYDPTLVTKPSLVVLTKSDLASAEEVKRAQATLSSQGLDSIVTSTQDKDSLAKLVQSMLKMKLTKIEPDQTPPAKLTPTYTIDKLKRTFAKKDD